MAGIRLFRANISMSGNQGSPGVSVLPNLLIIGAQKAATTSLHVYLDQHPQIQMSSPKELNFFAGPGFKNSELGLEWYESNFSPAAVVRGESSPSYTNYPIVGGVPERISELIPDCRLIYLVRDPVARMISQYRFASTVGRERRSFAEVVNAPRFDASGYVAKSRYAFQLSRYYEYFPPSQILVISQEELLRDRDRTMEAACRFLGVDPPPTGPAEVHYNASEEQRRPRWLARNLASVGALTDREGVVGRGARRILTRCVQPPAIQPELRARLQDLFREDAMRLRQMTGMAFAEWSV